jgi:transcriptional regulator with XRE-family HTH domain
MSFGDRLKKLRKSKNLSQQEFANRIGINRSTYSRYEIDDNQADYDTLKKISDFYDVSIDYLLTGHDRQTTSNEMWQELLNPEKQILFKDLLDAPEEKIEELIRFWEFIKERDKK